MLKFLLLASFVAAVAGQDAAIVWSATRRLTWDDFKGKAVRELDGARSALSTSMAVGCRDGVLQVRVVALFQPRQSSVTYRVLSSGLANRVGLDHEQIHFDLGEVYARRLRKMYVELRDPCPKADAELSAMANGLLRELASVQRRFDDETRSGELEAKQIEWGKRVAADLAALEAFKDGDLARLWSVLLLL